MMYFFGLLDLEHYLGRHFHQYFVIDLNQSQDILASSRRISTLCLMRTTLHSPFVLEPIFFNMKTVTWEYAFWMFIMTCLADLMTTITLVTLAVLSTTSI